MPPFTGDASPALSVPDAPPAPGLPGAVPAHWGPGLTRLGTAWRALAADAAAGRATAAADEVAAWTDALARLRTRHTALVAAGEWHTHGPRDLLTIAGLGRRETLHTAVLAWLFQPAPEHGLGPALLDVLLAAAAAPPATPDEHAATRVTAEEARAGDDGDRRADIVVRLPGRTVVVEAKVDAEESPHQCRDLVRLWSDEPDVRFVFLTPRGQPPRTAGDTAPLWRTLSFATLRDALAARVDTPGAVAARGAAAVRTYHHALEAHFPRSPAVEIDPRLRFYFENKALLDEWARLADDAGSLADRWFRTLADPLAGLAAELGPDVRLHPALDGGWRYFGLVRASWGEVKEVPRVSVAFGWNKPDAAFDRGFTGVWVHRPDSDVMPKLYKRVCRRIDALGPPKEQPRTAWLAQWGYVAPEGDAWWDDLPAFQARIVDHLRARWHTFAPAIDAAVAEP